MAEDFEQVRAPGFSVVLRGYDRATVERLLDEAARALGTGDPAQRARAASALREPVPVRLRGYDRAQVDAHLARVTRALTAG
jgi:DivIVA domain-containing protein